MILQIGLKGEQLNLYVESGIGNVQWEKVASPPKNQALTWYKVIYMIVYY